MGSGRVTIINKKHDSNEPQSTGTAELGWSPVRHISPIFAQGVMKAKETIMRWYLERDQAAVDECVALWESICKHPFFKELDLAFRLDSLN